MAEAGSGIILPDRMSEAHRPRWSFGGAALLTVGLAAACTISPSSPFQPDSQNVGGNPYNPDSPDPPEQIDNDAGQLVGYRPSQGGSYDAAPRQEGDATPEEGDSANPTTVPPVLDSGPADSGSAADSTSSSFDAPANEDAGPDAPPPPVDAAPPPDTAPPPVDAGTDTAPAIPDLCTSPLGASDLAVVEFMLSSQKGTGDMGQWVEIQSTQGCTLDLNGLHAAAAGPSSVYTLDVTTDLYLPGNGIFVIANTLDPTLNDNLPAGLFLFNWAGSPADVLSTTGGTITLSNSASGVQIDNLVYPQFQVVEVGTSISFPANCEWSDRSSWARWSFSTHDWFSTFLGTPNAPNTDVTCF